MRANRQDAWTKEEDDLLTKTVIDYIRQGYTQLESFRQVAEQLNRTAAACGFRWNATLRKRYTEEIEQAKQVRKKTQINNLSEKSHEDEGNKDHSISTLDQAISWLEKVKKESHHQATNQKSSQKNSIIEENKRLNHELSLYQTIVKNIKEQIEALEQQ